MQSRKDEVGPAGLVSDQTTDWHGLHKVLVLDLT